ncbi:PepSY-like domain-containing protein [Alistipes sp. i18-0019-D1]|uniref:PepSY-like domain-containing protein n=1 Tax=Alistipes sp. i18-0019-D1 TaxID=3132707 RepID=UPI0036F1BCD4
MKTSIPILAALLLLGPSAAHAGRDKAVSLGELPRRAQQFIREHFPAEEVAYAARKEREAFDAKYEVVFVGGMKVEFYRNGTWKEVDCRGRSIPKGVVPVPILNKVRELYGDVAVQEIDHDRRDFEVRLANGLELTFDLRYRLLEIDD